MTNGALPSRNRKNAKSTVWCLAIAGASALGWWGCSDAPSTPMGPSIRVQADNSGGDDNDSNRPPRITGGGRVDFCCGNPVKNNGTKFFQEFGFNVRIKKDNSIDGQLEFVDHRDAQEINGQPLRVKAIAWGSFTPTGADSDCAEGGGVATGTVVVKNTGQQLPFQLKVCDNGEPGKNAPWDRFFFSITGLTDSQTGEPYHMHHHPTEENSGAYLTGGNIQAKRV